MDGQASRGILAGVNSSGVAVFFAACGLAGILFRILEHPNVAFFIAAATGILILLWLQRSKGDFPDFAIGWEEIAICAIIILQTVSLFTSVYARNSFESLADTVFFGLLYFIAKSACMFRNARLFLYASLTCFGVFLSLETIVGASVWSAHLRDAGFRNFTEFRSYLPSPLHIPPGETVSLLLVLVPFALAVTWISRGAWIWAIYGTIPITAGICMTFSRGGYVGLIVFLALTVSALFACDPHRRRRLLIIASTLVVGTVLVVGFTPLLSSVLKTFQMGDSAAHGRSIQGRYVIWRRAAGLLLERPISGIGGSNFALVDTAREVQKDHGEYSPRAFNSFLETLVENGILGTLPYILLLAAFYYHSLLLLRSNHCRETKGLASIFACGISALLVRDLTYSSLFANAGVASVVFLTLGHNLALQNAGVAGQVDLLKLDEKP